MNKLLLIGLISTLLLAGCGAKNRDLAEIMDTEVENTEVIESSIIEDELVESEMDEKNSPTKVKEVAENTSTELSMYGLNMSLPKGWTSSKLSDSKALILFKDGPYDITLPVEVVKNSGQGLGNEVTLVNETEKFNIYVNPCGGGTGCFMINKFEDAIYNVNFGKLTSTEDAPKNLKDAWSPSTIVSQGQLIEILKTIK